MKALLILATALLAGCVSTRPPAHELTKSAEETLGTYLIVSAVTQGKPADMIGFLTAVYPLRAQLVTFAVIGYHRDHGRWPQNNGELDEYMKSSPANPTLPEDALVGFTITPKEDGGVVFSTLEDRQRGREFTVSKEYKVSFPVPANPYASAAAAERPIAQQSKLSFDWSQLFPAIIQALLHAQDYKKK